MRDRSVRPSATRSVAPCYASLRPQPFVEHLVATANHRQAVAYVPKCDPRRRVDLYVLCGEWAKAGADCRERGDRGRLLELRQRCPNALIAAQLDSCVPQRSRVR